MLDRLLGVFTSRRFYMAVGGVLVVIFQDGLGFDEATANGVVAVMVAWILGDSIQKTGTVSGKKIE